MIIILHKLLQTISLILLLGVIVRNGAVRNVSFCVDLYTVINMLCLSETSYLFLSVDVQLKSAGPWFVACADPERGTGVPDPPPLRTHKNIGFLSNTGPDPLKNHKATKSACIVGPSSARQRFADGPMMTRF